MNPVSLLSETANIRAHYTDWQAIARIQAILQNRLASVKGRQIILLCIGTDRSTGDSLGPLTGTKLQERLVSGLSVIGTLDEPVHAANLETTLANIQRKTNNPFIIALDACLGQLDSVGYITLADGPLKPGTAVKKELPEVGEIHLTGIVNVNGFMQYIVLQNTRLSIVWQMADTLCNLFLRCSWNVLKR